jgi:hypothetical protein
MGRGKKEKEKEKEKKKKKKSGQPLEEDGRGLLTRVAYPHQPAAAWASRHGVHQRNDRIASQGVFQLSCSSNLSGLLLQGLELTAFVKHVHCRRHAGHRTPRKRSCKENQAVQCRQETHPIIEDTHREHSCGTKPIQMNKGKKRECKAFPSLHSYSCSRHRYIGIQLALSSGPHAIMSSS